MVNILHPRTFEDLGEISPLERDVIEAMVAGQTFRIGEGDLPDPEDRSRAIDARVVRYLALGGCDRYPTHERGLDIYGALVTGSLDLDGCKSVVELGLPNCRFEMPLRATNAKIGAIYLDGAYVPELEANGAQVEGNMQLNGGFQCAGEVGLIGARIGGNLDCRKSGLGDGSGIALNAHSADVGGGVFLQDGFVAQGMVNLAGARIGGQLVCRGGRFEFKDEIAINLQGADIRGGVFMDNGFDALGEVNMASVELEGPLICSNGTFCNDGGYALDIQGGVFNGGILLTDSKVTCGRLNMMRAKAEFLQDRPEDWPEEGFELDGFEYGAILGSTLDVNRRLEWLEKSHLGYNDFKPQPYQQLAKYYGEIGHRRDRGAVLIEMERRLHNWQFVQTRENARHPWDHIVAYAHKGFALAADWIVGFGHRPAKSLIWTVLVIAAISFWAKASWDEGSMVPASDQILVSDEWLKYADGPEYQSQTPTHLWVQESAAGPDYENFHPVAYAADLFIPLVELGQTAMWTPSPLRGTWGYHLWWLKWLVEGFGWVVTAMGAAAITGIIRND